MKFFITPFRKRFFYGCSPMIKSTIMLFFSIFFLSLSYSQSGALKGKIVDKDTRGNIPFANVVIFLDSTTVAGNTSDFDGNYTVKPIDPGTYDVKVTYVGYKTSIIKGIVIKADQIRFLDIEIESTTESLPEYIITDYKVPLISRDQTISGGHVTSESIKRMSNRCSSAIATCVGGVFSADGERGNVRGSRADQTIMYIDGIRVLGSTSIPSSSIEQVSVYTGGVPAQYENANDGSITEMTVTNAAPNASSSDKTETENRIQPKLLTAGEINDFSKWELWSDISNDALKSYRDIWAIYPDERYSVQILNVDNFPVVDCKVMLVDESGNIIWEARSDNTGKAELWAGIFDSEAKTESTYKILIDDNGKIEEMKKPKRFHKGINTIKLNSECESIETVDILFTVDATGSMADEIRYLKVELNDIIKNFSAKNPQLEIRLGSVFYKCFGNSYVTKTSAFSEDISKTIEFINDEEANGGGTEAVEEALRVSVEEMEWSNSSVARLMFLVLDESPGRTDDITKTMNKAVKDAAAKGIRIIPVVASGTGYHSDKALEYLMRSIALASNGTYVFLTDDSGIGGKHTEPSIDDYEVELLNDLILRLLAQYTFVEDCNQKDVEKIIPEVTEVEKPEQKLVAETDEVIEEQEKTEEIEEKTDKASKEANEKIWINAYPNPTRGVVNIEYGKKVNELYVVDISGKVLQKVTCKDKSKISVDLSPFPNGMYFLKYANVDHWEYAKVILRH